MLVAGSRERERDLDRRKSVAAPGDFCDAAANSSPPELRWPFASCCYSSGT